MQYYKLVDEEGYIFCIGTGNGGEEISQAEYETILSVIKTRPVAEPGFVYKLRADLTWELCVVPPVEEEDEEAAEEDYLAALAALGVSLDEEI